MADLSISPDGEVKLNYDVVGRIAWASPVAHLSAAGEWDDAGGTCCYDCGGLTASQEYVEEIEDERDGLASDLEKATDKITSLKGALVDLMAAYAACNGKDHPAYSRASDAISGQKADADA